MQWERIHFEGLLAEDALLREYASCDILVAPSRFESFGLVLLEAMRVGKPVVACRVGGMVDIVEEGGNGFMVPPGDASALESALARLIESADLRAAFGARSRQLFEERYSVDRMVAGVNREYNRVTGTSTAGSGASVERPIVAAIPALPPGAVETGLASAQRRWRSTPVRSPTSARRRQPATLGSRSLSVSHARPAGGRSRCGPGWSPPMVTPGPVRSSARAVAWWG